MRDLSTKRKRGRVWQKAYYTKKALEDNRYKRKIHIDAKFKEKENKFKFTEEDYET